MRAEERRQAIREILRTAEKPVSAAALAARFSVSRQIIVGDIALLRAAGEAISATPRGYVTERAPAGLVRRVAVRHRAEQMGDELNAMVDNGCTVLDVVIEHAVYGQLTGELHLKDRRDVAEFIRRVREEGAAPLSALTGGIHLHTLLCQDEGSFARCVDALREAGILLE